MRPLADYGITSFMPMLSCNLALAGEAAQALHAAMCAVVGKLGAGNRVPNRIKVGPIKLPKFSPWDSLRYSDVLASRATRMLSADLASENRSAFCEFGGANPRPRVDRPTSYPLHCPLCGTRREAANAWLYKAKGSSSLRCDPCARYIASRKWLCPCNRPWIQSESHRALVEALAVSILGKADLRTVMTLLGRDRSTKTGMHFLLNVAISTMRMPHCSLRAFR